MCEQEIFHNELLNDLNNGTLALPTLPEVALHVRDVVDDPEASATDLSEVIITDAALATNLLKVANSPLYRGRVEVDTIQMAVSRLGLKVVRSLVTCLVMKQMFQATSRNLDDRLHNLWAHTTDVSAICQVLARKHANIKSDVAMLAGLIHEIGILPILMKADEKPEILKDTAALNAVIENIHVAVGAQILKSWRFPEALVTAVAEQSNLTRDSENGPDIVDIVQVARLQSYMNTDGALSEEELKKVPAFKKLGVDTAISVVELDENSDEYKEALALFDF